MPNWLTVSKLKRPKLNGWPFVAILGVALALIALVYGGAMGNLDTTCTLRVEVPQVTVVNGPVATAARLRTAKLGDQLKVDAGRPQQDGYWKLDGENAWVRGGDTVAATSGSHC